MREVYRVSSTIISLALGLLMLYGCGGGAGADLAAPGLNPQWPLPAPGSLHAVSATELSLQGRDYEATWAHDNVAAAGTAGRYTPDYAGATKDFEHLAYAIYSFSVTGYTGAPELHVSITTTGETDSGWVGLADYSNDRWDWYQLPMPSASESLLTLTLANRSQGGAMPVALVFTGAQPWQVSTLKLGGVDLPGPGDWPMSGKDRLNTHLSAGQGPQSNALHAKFACNGPGTLYTGLATGPDGKIYAGNSDSVYAYSDSGALLWQCSGVTPITNPAVAADGTVYVGGGYPNMGLHAISSDGALQWTYETTMDVGSNPAIAPDGTIYFGCDDASFYGVNPDGSFQWSRALPSAVRGSPLVTPDGAIYVGYQTGGFNPVGHLLALNANHSEKWDNTTGTLPRMRPAVSEDGGVFCINKDGEVIAYNADGSSRYNKSLSASAYAMPLAGAGNVLYFGSKDGKLYKLNADGSTAWTYTSDGEVMGGPVMAVDGTIVAATMNGVLFGVDSNGDEQFSYSSGSTGLLAPAVGSNQAYFCTDNGYLNAVAPDGSLVWQIGAGGTLLANPVVTEDGTAYVGCADGQLYAIRPNGTLKWRYATGRGINSSPAIGADGTVYVGSQDYKLHAVNPDGTALWQFDTTGYIESSPVLGDDGVIYFGSNDTYLYAVRPDGTQKWSFKTKWNVNGSPAVSDSGTVYVGSWDRYVYSIDAYGQENWSYKTDGLVKGGVLIGPDGVVYAGCEKDTENGVMYALRAAGTKKWSFNTSGPVRMCPALCPDGGIVFGTAPGSSASGSIYALNSDGQVKWQYSPAPCGGLSLAVDSDGVVYAGTEDGHLYALEDLGNSSSLKWSFDQPGSKIYSPAIALDRIYIGLGSSLYILGN